VRHHSIDGVSFRATIVTVSIHVVVDSLEGNTRVLGDEIIEAPLGWSEPKLWFWDRDHRTTAVASFYHLTT